MKLEKQPAAGLRWAGMNEPDMIEKRDDVSKKGDEKECKDGKGACKGMGEKL